MSNISQNVLSDQMLEEQTIRLNLLINRHGLFKKKDQPNTRITKTQRDAQNARMLAEQRERQAERRFDIRHTAHSFIMDTNRHNIRERLSNDNFTTSINSLVRSTRVYYEIPEKIAKKSVNTDRFKVTKYKPSSRETGHHENCSICLEDYKLKDNITTLPCNHIYHVTCINEWFSQGTKCPLCNHSYI